MLYKFKSRATGDLIMLEPHARRVLAAMGREPSAQGIVLPQDMPEAVARIEQAMAREDAERDAAKQAAREARDVADTSQADDQESALGLRQRAKPMLDMLRRSLQEDCEIVWGV